jgi:Transposase DDE domain
MAATILPGGCDTREHAFEQPAAPALVVRSHRPRLAAPPPPTRPTQPKGGRPCPEWRWREYVDAIVYVNRTGRTWRMLPTTSPSAGRQPTSTSCAGPATAPGTAPSPSCAARSAMPAAATPTLGRRDRLLLDQSVTRSWSLRLRRRQEDQRQQTPRRRGHPRGLLVAVLVTAASVQDRTAVPRLLARARTAARQAGRGCSRRCGRVHRRWLHRRPGCRHGDLSQRPGPAHQHHRVATFGALCRTCPLRQRCTTTSKTGRKLVLHDHDVLLRQARRDWAEHPGLRERYRRHRPGVGRVISQLASRGGRRLRLRYLVQLRVSC